MAERLLHDGGGSQMKCAAGRVLTDEPRPVCRSRAQAFCGRNRAKPGQRQIGALPAPNLTGARRREEPLLPEANAFGDYCAVWAKSKHVPPDSTGLLVAISRPRLPLLAAVFEGMGIRGTCGLSRPCTDVESFFSLP